MCRTIRRNRGRSAWSADSKGATERRLSGMKSAMRKTSAPLVLQRRIFTLCTKVHALLSGKNPCPESKKAHVFLSRNHVFTGHTKTACDISARGRGRCRAEKKQQLCARACSTRVGKPLQIQNVRPGTRSLRACRSGGWDQRRNGARSPRSAANNGGRSTFD